MFSDPLSALLDVVRALDDLSIPYAIGGSFASSVFGEPRASADADLIAAISGAKLSALLAHLEGGYYVSDDAARDAVRRHSSFNVIHLDSMYKIAIFVAGPSQMDQEQLRRKVRVDLTAAPDTSAFVTAAENLVLRKLDWFRQSGEASDRQRRDVLGILKVRAGALDTDYLRRLARDTGLEGLLDRALEQSTPDHE